MCEKCPKREKCKTLCKKVKAHLRKCGIKSEEWIRPERSSLLRKDGKGKTKEVPFSALTTQDKEEFRLKYGDIFDI